MYKLKFTPTFEAVVFVPKELTGLKKYRVGDWRLFFWLDNKEKTIILYGIEHRKSAYRRF